MEKVAFAIVGLFVIAALNIAATAQHTTVIALVAHGLHLS
jgi:hypothetical protein